jgi:hypothetical protein
MLKLRFRIANALVSGKAQVLRNSGQVWEGYLSEQGNSHRIQRS